MFGLHGFFGLVGFPVGLGLVSGFFSYVSRLCFFGSFLVCFGRVAGTLFPAVVYKQQVLTRPGDGPSLISISFLTSTMTLLVPIVI